MSISNNHKIIIIDRRNKINNFDILYIISCNKFILHELRKNYFIGFEYKLNNQTNNISMYTHYAVIIHYVFIQNI